MKVIAIIGARPQFIKHFAFEKACESKVELMTVHTGQHYDENMSAVFFDQLGMKKPDYQLSIGSGNHGIQTAQMMIEIESIVLKEKPDIMVVYGDTNSTLAGALVAAKLHIKIAHIEAGLRSYNKEMPEEVNRILTDHVSDYLFVPSEISVSNLKHEGITKGVHIVGDIMKDVVIHCKSNNLIPPRKSKEEYFYITLHRPYNTDDKARLTYVLQSLNGLDKKAIFAIHPRTRNLMQKYNMMESEYSNIEFIEPQGYFDNLSFLNHSSGLITDSGGMQKEAYWLKKKCVTIRKETEWTETLTDNANELMFDDLSDLNTAINRSSIKFDNKIYGDGKAGDYIVSKLVYSL